VIIGIGRLMYFFTEDSFHIISIHIL